MDFGDSPVELITKEIHMSSFILVKKVGLANSFFHQDGFIKDVKKAKQYPHIKDAVKAATALNNPNVRVKKAA